MPFVQAAAASALALLVLPADAVKLQRLRGGTASISMHLFRDDCGKPSGFSFLQNPGAGMTPEAIAPFNHVLKDGFYSVDCVKDYMFEHGDKFGDNKASYKLGDLTNVSIVHYAAHVPKEDRQEMTHEVCFRFCRTVPEMGFFGLTNGRECYCTPYYQAEASDSSDCDAVCDGDKGTMCGGKTKSSIFAMHQCTNTAQQLGQVSGNLGDAASQLEGAAGAAGAAAEGLQQGATHFQELFGQAGDPGAAELMQAAKAFAGVLDEQVRAANEVLAHKTELATAASAAAGGDLTQAKNLGAAEDLIRSMEQATTEAELSAEKLEDLMKAMPASPVANASQQYYPAMYFADKTHEQAPATCTGDASEKPMFTTVDGCATACDADVHECVAYGFYATEVQGQEAGAGLCFLFSKLKTVRYYTGCQDQGHVQCYAKLSKFEGTSIKPDASGKCEGCLKELNQADRCYQ